uniref:Uncharacterized protein n=1 Tax=Oryza rufipogon TaxID=4529 RepID=A0A0E0NBL4_ORYRU
MQEGDLARASRATSFASWARGYSADTKGPMSYPVLPFVSAFFAATSMVAGVLLPFCVVPPHHRHIVQCEDLKLKYYEEMAKRKKLHNIVGRPKGAFVPFNSTNMGCSHGLPVLARASAGTAGLAAARGAGAVGRAQLSLLPRDDHDCCSHSGAHALQGSECELTTWSATMQVCLGIARLARSVSLIQRTVRHRCECQTGSPCDHPPASSTSSLKATLCRRTVLSSIFFVIEVHCIGDIRSWEWRDETVY